MPKECLPGLYVWQFRVIIVKIIQCTTCYPKTQQKRHNNVYSSVQTSTMHQNHTENTTRNPPTHGAPTHGRPVLAAGPPAN